LNCRKCRAEKETLGHILGLYVYTKQQRIYRHDQIKDLILVTTLKKNKDAVASRESTLQVPDGGRLKLDLVIKIQDVTIRHEDRDTLSRAREEKLHKYSPIMELLKTRMDVQEGEIIPVVTGTRGAMPKK
jgi:hypothetical protein